MMTDDIRKSRLGLLAGSIILAATPSAQGQTQSAPAADITPFKAVYNLSFAPPNNQSVIISGQGRLAVEITGNRCTEYRVIRTVNFTMNTKNGVDKFQSEVTIVENPAGTQIAVSYSDRLNGKQTQQYSLIGRRNDDGSVTVSSRNLPGGKAQLPKGTLFPMQHELRLNAADVAGRKSIASSVFNPELSITTVEQVTASFGPENKAALPAGHVANIEKLKNLPRRRAELTFRDLKTGKVRAQERMTRFPNGILTVSDVLTEIMKIKAAIGSLTMLPRGACS